jgi:hypothetical protein
VKKGAELFLRWPSGDLSPLIPLNREQLIDRAYWVPVGIVRNERGIPRSITYDRFEGVRAN